MFTQPTLTGVFVQEPDNQGFTAFFAQFPNIIAEGDTEQESENNLIQLVNDVFNHQANQEMQQFENDQTLTKANVTTKQYKISAVA